MSSSAPADRDAESQRTMEQASLQERRRRYRETDMSERLEAAFELSALARELRAGVVPER